MANDGQSNTNKMYEVELTYPIEITNYLDSAVWCGTVHIFISQASGQLDITGYYFNYIIRIVLVWETILCSLQESLVNDMIFVYFVLQKENKTFISKIYHIFGKSLFFKNNYKKFGKT